MNETLNTIINLIIKSNESKIDQLIDNLYDELREQAMELSTTVQLPEPENEEEEAIESYNNLMHEIESGVFENLVKIIKERL